MNCPKCGSSHTIKKGRNKSGTQAWMCLDCPASDGRRFSEGDNPQHRPPINGAAMTDAERAKNYYWREKVKHAGSNQL